MDVVENRPMNSINHQTNAQDNVTIYMERVGDEGTGEGVII